MQSSCLLCGLRSPHDFICSSCLLLLPWNRQACVRCASPLDAQTHDGAPCASCQAQPPAFDAALAPFCYEFPVDVTLKALKFRRELCYAPAFASLTAAIVKTRFPDCDALLPVPLHRWRHVLRGFNQAHEIANELGRRISLPVLDIASRVRATRPQTGLHPAQRRANVRNAFAIQRKDFGRFPLIVDDVMTTGATCDQLARVLRENGAQEVSVFAVARA